jgi:hypothetical protein
MSATLIVRHTVADHAAWRVVYDEVDTLRTSHGCTAQRVLQLPGDANDVVAIHEFPTVDQAREFAEDPALKDAMHRAGVTGPPRIEIFESA